MKRNTILMTLLVSTLALTGCNKDEDNGSREPAVSKQAQAALTEKYPNATNVRWTAKDKYVVASFSLPESRAAEAGIDLAAWFVTETDIPFTALPEAVQTAFNASEYASAPWRTDDVDMLEREGVETIYVIEVEKRENGIETEIDLYYSADGVLVKMLTDSAPDYDYGDYIPSTPATRIEQYISTK